jgi:hypothetical protein
MRLFRQIDLFGRSKYLVDVENHYKLAIASANRNHEGRQRVPIRGTSRHDFVELGDRKDSDRCRLAFEIACWTPTPPASTITSATLAPVSVAMPSRIPSIGESRADRELSRVETKALLAAQQQRRHKTRSCARASKLTSIDGAPGTLTRDRKR